MYLREIIAMTRLFFSFLDTLDGIKEEFIFAGKITLISLDVKWNKCRMGHLQGLFIHLIPLGPLHISRKFCPGSRGFFESLEALPLPASYGLCWDGYCFRTSTSTSTLLLVSTFVSRQG